MKPGIMKLWFSRYLPMRVVPVRSMLMAAKSLPTPFGPTGAKTRLQEFSWGLQEQPNRHSQATEKLKFIAALSVSTGQQLPSPQQSARAGLEEQPDSSIGISPTCERPASITAWPFTCTVLE